MARIDFTSHRLFVDAPLEAGAIVVINPDQANYLVNVLRLGDGKGFLVFNGRDGEWQARIAGGNRKALNVEILTQTRAQPPQRDLWYLFAPLKAARLDYMVQKAVEMGATRLTPVMTRRTQVSRLNLERMQANVIEAAEQCGVLQIPETMAETPLEKLLSAWPEGRYLVFCDEDAPVRDPVAALAKLPRDARLAVIIGPEGGFDPAERMRLTALPLAVTISLGERILRADTAAVAALALIEAVFGTENDRSSL